MRACLKLHVHWLEIFPMERTVKEVSFLSFIPVLAILLSAILLEITILVSIIGVGQGGERHQDKM